ncbi:tRNA N(3)-methylcytidine methyltransferase METTL6 [Contarinia nasturtii]|uniref:tRNA N(3)-methylcytidine methyltransferase METTL6 n=1 Tax=Contarinia nasturtii TaxID=265458 RepID=UPI0012D4773A|nr:tRNA N(3)-methylcytidine methyltransferase METTL6 [Contarinia nasturtii]
MSDSWESMKGPKVLSAEESEMLERQNSRLVNEFKANQLEKDALRNWDLFYKRNDTRFFRDRHWTTREFQELIDEKSGDSKKILLEVGCGVGNFCWPLIEDKFNENYFIYACDFSPRAIEFVKQNSLYDEQVIKAFQCDITSETIFETIEENSVDLISMIFVLSAIHPDKFDVALRSMYRLLKPGGTLLFRDYGLHDMAQIRFKPGNKISDKFYVRQDGTRSYYFSTEELEQFVRNIGFEVSVNEYIHRKTINIKENIDKERVFVQSKFKKPIA